MVDGLSIEDLVVRADRHDLVDGLELSLGPGSVLGIVGPSGSGKTTLLRTLGGLRSPQAGRVTLGGSPVDPGEVGYVSQEHVLLGRLTAAENVAVRLLALKDRRSGDDVSALLAGLGLPESSWHNLVEQLSGGQQQRVAVARALAGRPRLLCLDDPTSELDEASAALVWEQVGVAVAAGAIAVLAVAEVPEGLQPDAIVSTAAPR